MDPPKDSKLAAQPAKQDEEKPHPCVQFCWLIPLILAALDCPLMRALSWQEASVRNASRTRSSGTSAGLLIDGDTHEWYSKLLNNKPMPVCYDGFEPSGRMHIAQGIMKATNVNKLTKAGTHTLFMRISYNVYLHLGCQFIFWVADWFALMNDKMGGDIKKIQLIGRHMIEVRHRSTRCDSHESCHFRSGRLAAWT